MQELWKPIRDYEDYMVSNKGNVKSQDRYRSNGKGIILKRGRVLKFNILKGYLAVTLHNKGKSKKIRVHRLVYEAFNGELIEGLQVDHIDNNRLNNHNNNLQQITNRENCSKDRKNGTSKYTGVSWDKRDKKWRSQIIINKKKHYLGLFTNELEAAEAYKRAINKL